MLTKINDCYVNLGRGGGQAHIISPLDYSIMAMFSFNYKLISQIHLMI